MIPVHHIDIDTPLLRILAAAKGDNRWLGPQGGTNGDQALLLFDDRLDLLQDGMGLGKGEIAIRLEVDLDDAVSMGG